MGKLRGCPSCGQEVSKKAAACPKCGHAFKKSGSSPIVKLGCFVVILIGAGIFGFTAICGKAVTEVAKEHEKEKTVGASATTSAFSTTAAQICKDYEENELAATKRYKDQVFTVTGTLGGVQTDIMDEPFMTLTCGGEFSFQSVHAKPLEGAHDRVATLKKGDRVKLKCKGGTEIVGSPMLNGCVFVD